MPNTCKTANDTPETDAAPRRPHAGGVGYEVWLARQIESLRERHGGRCYWQESAAHDPRRGA